MPRQTHKPSRNRNQRPALNREYQRGLKLRKRVRLQRAEEHREMMRDFYRAPENGFTVADLKCRAHKLQIAVPARTPKADIIERLVA